LPVGLKVGWGIGAIGAVTMLTLVNVLLMYFMVNYLNIDPAVAGAVVFATRIYDTVFDPAMGWISDRVQTRWGRRRPWMLLAAVISAVTCLAAFNPPALDPGAALPAYMLLILVLYFSGYTMFYIPFMAMPAEMTTDPDERTSIMSYRTFFSGAGGMMATAVAPALVSYLGRTREAYAQTGAIIAAIIGLCMLIAALSTRGARHTVPSSVRYPWRDWVASIFSNRPLVALLATKVLVYFEISIVAGFGLFFMNSAIGRGEKGQAMLGALMNGVTLVILPLMVRFVKGKPKKRMLTLAVAIHGLATLSWIFATPEEADAIFILRCVGIGIGYAAIVLMVLSMMPDVIAYDFERTGLRREGVLSSLFAFVEKLAYALTPLVTGFLLKAVGYVQGKGGTLAQPDAAIWGVRLGTSVLPAVLALAGIVCLRFYHLEPAARPTMEEAP
jgi:GPH family glycoside/pentoside/hexuronide:cation symporter